MSDAAPTAPSAPGRLFRRHVARRAYIGAGQRHRRLRCPVKPLRQAKVSDLERAVRRPEHVPRFEVAVDDPAFVSKVDGASEYGCGFRGLPRREGRAFERLREAGRHP